MSNPSPNPSGRFRPGQSGNPGGRAKGRSLSALLRTQLDADDGEGRTKGDRLAETLVNLALAGNLRAIELVIDRVDGKAPPAGNHDNGDALAFREFLHADFVATAERVWGPGRAGG